MVRTRARGMTLIEVMVALVVTTVGILGALAMISSLFVGATFNRNATEAMTLAQSTIEQVDSQIITMSSPADGPAAAETGLDAYGVTGSGPTNIFTRQLTWGTTLDNQRRSVNVVVSWNDGAGKAHQVVLTGERIP
jgi:prepilin-type N-terminal cleavage/methylation domain-containing protein